MRKIREVLRLKYELGFTHRTIAKALRVAVGTVSEYLAKAKKGGLSWPLPEELSDGELEAGLFPPPGSSGARPGLDYAHIHEELRRYCQVDVERANLSRRADVLCSHRTAQVTSCQTMKARSRSSR